MATKVHSIWNFDLIVVCLPQWIIKPRIFIRTTGISLMLIICKPAFFSLEHLLIAIQTLSTRSILSCLILLITTFLWRCGEIFVISCSCLILNRHSSSFVREMVVTLAITSILIKGSRPLIS